MIYYHASTVKISEFYVPYGGIHVGGKHSALEAALRKARSNNNEDIYLHTVHVNLGRTYTCSDLGDCQSWRNMIEYCQLNNYNSVMYKNDFEPDICNSVMLFDSTRIIINNIELIRFDSAEDIISSFYDYIGYV